MSKLLCRCSVATIAVAIVLLSSRSAEAQIFLDPPRLHGGFLDYPENFSWREQLSRKHALKRLPHVQEQLRYDAAQGDGAAVNHDLRTIDTLHYRVAVDNWLIRKMYYQEPGCYPYPKTFDHITSCTIGQYERPARPNDGR